MSSKIIYLYIKQHSITGLKYFGKTTKANPYSYKGSGKHWLRHLKKHGRKHVETIQVWQFTSIEEASAFALKFSKDNDIINSASWANIIEENGQDGRPVGCSTSVETGRKISAAKVGRNVGSDNHFYGKHHTDETKAKIRDTVEERYGKNKPWLTTQAIQKRAAKIKGQIPHNAQAVTYNGIMYPSIRKCAAANGLSMYKMKRLLT